MSSHQFALPSPVLEPSISGMGTKGDLIDAMNDAMDSLDRVRNTFATLKAAFANVALDRYAARSLEIETTLLTRDALQV